MQQQPVPGSQMHGRDDAQLSIPVSRVLSKGENLEETYNQLKIIIIYPPDKNQIMTNKLQAYSVHVAVGVV